MQAVPNDIHPENVDGRDFPLHVICEADSYSQVIDSLLNTSDRSLLPGFLVRTGALAQSSASALDGKYMLNYQSFNRHPIYVNNKNKKKPAYLYFHVQGQLGAWSLGFQIPEHETFPQADVQQETGHFPVVAAAPPIFVSSCPEGFAGYPDEVAAYFGNTGVYFPQMKAKTKAQAFMSRLSPSDYDPL